MQSPTHGLDAYYHNNFNYLSRCAYHLVHELGVFIVKILSKIRLDSCVLATCGEDRGTPRRLWALYAAYCLSMRCCSRESDAATSAQRKASTPPRSTRRGICHRVTVAAIGAAKQIISPWRFSRWVSFGRVGLARIGVTRSTQACLLTADRQAPGKVSAAKISIVKRGAT